MYLGLKLSLATMTSTSPPGPASHKNQSVDLHPGFTLEKPGELSKTSCPQRTAERFNQHLSGVGFEHQYLKVFRGDCSRRPRQGTTDDFEGQEHGIRSNLHRYPISAISHIRLEHLTSP